MAGTHALLAPERAGIRLQIDNAAFPALSAQQIASFDNKKWTKIGPFNVEANPSSPLAEEKGMTTVLAYPVQAVPGLELVGSVFSGHRDTRLGAPAGSAAVTGGIRFRW
ncbi:hypothetical protein [Kozakia baliensis]|uniref:hypothetical protein n=1 Tax=Kozakia baliensis TaxID=153496 RepID=UPI0011BF36DF|nr:hypothetical protein [Kozakia baliensis]